MVHSAPMLVTLNLLDALLAHPWADAVYIGAGPVEDILHLDAVEDWDEELAQRCLASAAWRETVYSAVWPDEVSLPHLRRYMRTPLHDAPHVRRRGPPSAERLGTSGNAAAHIDGRCRDLPGGTREGGSAADHSRTTEAGPVAAVWRSLSTTLFRHLHEASRCIRDSGSQTSRRPRSGTPEQLRGRGHRR